MNNWKKTIKARCKTAVTIVELASSEVNTTKRETSKADDLPLKILEDHRLFIAKNFKHGLSLMKSRKIRIIHFSLQVWDCSLFELRHQGSHKFVLIRILFINRG